MILRPKSGGKIAIFVISGIKHALGQCGSQKFKKLLLFLVTLIYNEVILGVNLFPMEFTAAKKPFSDEFRG